MRWGGVDWGATVLWWWSWGRVVHIGGHLGHNVPRRRSDWRGSCGHWGGRGLVVHHVWRTRSLGRMLHGVIDRRGRGWWGAEVLLRWGHHVVSVGHHRGLTGIVPRVVVGWLAGPRTSRERLPRGRVILNGHCDEIAMLAGRHCGDAKCLGAQGTGGRGFVG